MFSRATAIGAVLLAAASFSACNSNFDLNLTSDDHALLSVSDNYSQTVYPIVFVHGLYGFDDIFGMEYWYDIPQVLVNGGSEVYVAEVSGAHSPAVRGEQLIIELERFRLQSSQSRFHLIGHSLGGPTIRYAAAKRPDLVVTATSIAGANHGSQAANNDRIELPLVRGIIMIMGNMLGHVIDLVSQNSFEQNILAATDAMNQEGAAAFNAEYPDGIPATYCNGAENSTLGFSHASTNPDYVENNPINSYDDFSVYYDNAQSFPNAAGPFSYSYDSDGDLSPENYEILYYSIGGILAESNGLDPLDSLHRATADLMEPDDQNDGMVERCSTHNGYVIKDNFYMNHLDFMNWFVGLRDDRAPYAPSFYRAHAHYLKNIGL